jgi:hypothetical protein
MQKIIKINRLWFGKASIRSCVVDQAIKEKEDLMVSFGGNFMTIPWQDLHEGIISKDVFQSKYDNKSYRLVDFNWKPDKINQIELI